MAAGLLAPHPATAQQLDGERLFRQRCASCHSLEPGRAGTGPHLADLMGRTAGSIEDARYSEAMRNSGVVWSAETLDTFLAAPRRSMPGTRMTIAIPDANQRTAIVDYLQNLSPEQGTAP